MAKDGSRRGGARPGAGRKPGQIKASGVNHLRALRSVTAIEILGVQNEFSLWAKLLHSKDERVALQALMYLTDRRDGRPYMALNPNAPGSKPPDPRLLEAIRKYIPQSGTVTVTQQIAMSSESKPDPTPVLEATNPQLDDRSDQR